MERPAAVGSRRTAFAISRDNCKSGLIIPLFASRSCENAPIWLLLFVATVAVNTSIASTFAGRKARMRRRDLRTPFVRFPNNDGFVAGLIVSHVVVVVVRSSCLSCSLLPGILVTELICYAAQQPHTKCIPEVRP